MSKISWPPKDYKLEPEETQYEVFCALLNEYKKKLPPTTVTGMIVQMKLAKWRERYKKAISD